MSSQTLAFEDKSPYILDTFTVKESKQKGGKKKTKEVTKLFMFQLLKLTTHLIEPEANSSEKCFFKLKPFISNDFTYNKITGDKGLQLLCRHMEELKKAFPNMNLSVTHFRDTDKHSIIIILMVLGVMKGNWLNTPASNKYERLGIVFHLLTNKDKDKITEINFKSEYIPEDCYKKIRALDLLHTAFAINKSVEEAKHKNGNIKQSKTVQVPLILVQTNNDVVKHKDIQDNIDIRREREEDEEDFRREIEEAEAEANAEKLFVETNKNAKELEEIEKENMFPENESSENYTQSDDESYTEEEEEKEQYVQQNQVKDYESSEDENNNENLKKTLEMVQENPESFGMPLEEGVELNTNNILQFIKQQDSDVNNTNNISIIRGGDGYYTAVEQLPIAGRPVIQGYKSCFKPYFKTSGDEFDYMCKIGGKFNDNGNHIALKSKTLLMVKNGVIYSITASIIDSIGENTADVMGVKGIDREKIKNHMKRHMHNHTYKVVKEIINNGTPKLSSVIPSNDSQIDFIPSQFNRDMQKGGNFIGTLGTLLFPAGNTISNIMPWFLTLGSVLFKRIEKDVYKVSKTIGKKKVKSTQKPKKTVKKPSKTSKKIVKKPSKTSKKTVRLTKKVQRKKWEPLTNANVRNLMRKSQLGGECGSGLCGDPSLRYFEGCKKPEWGFGSKNPMCI